VYKSASKEKANNHTANIYQYRFLFIFKIMGFV